MVLLESLRAQEAYFGGQATGLAVVENGSIQWAKRPGPVDWEPSSFRGLAGGVGMAHSRLSQASIEDPRHNKAANAHPFLDEAGQVALMHNGIIFNYKELWEELAPNHRFSSYNGETGEITDSEVAVHLVDEALAQGCGLGEAVAAAARRLEGMFLLVVASPLEPDAVYIANWMQACTLGLGDGEAMFSSSPRGLQGLGRQLDAFPGPRNSLIRMTAEGFQVRRLDPCRAAPRVEVDPAGFQEAVSELLGGGEWMCSLEVLLGLRGELGARAMGLGLEEWRRAQRQGWGDQNQIVEPLEELARRGLLKRRTVFREEAGVKVPRIEWSLG